MNNYLSIKLAYEKYILHRNKQSFQKRIHLGHNHTEGNIYIIFSVSNMHMKNTFYTATSNHLKKGSTLLHITKDKGQITDGPQYNKCWNLEFLQDNI